MRIDSLLKGGIYKVSFGYNSDLYGYMMSMLDIMKLCAIRKPAFLKRIRMTNMLLPLIKTVKIDKIYKFKYNNRKKYLNGPVAHSGFRRLN